MKKEYFANVEFNKKKRRTTVLLGVILTFSLLIMAAVFAFRNDYAFALIFILFITIPIATIPSAFKSHPVHGKPIISMEKGVIISNNKAFDVKDIKKVIVLIELPSTKIDKDDLEILRNLRTSYPEDEFYGSFDIGYSDEKGKTKIEYAYIDHVVDALYTAVKMGLRNYEIKFTIKKNTVVNECDLKKKIELDEKDSSLEKVSKKARKRQLI